MANGWHGLVGHRGARSAVERRGKWVHIGNPGFPTGLAQTLEEVLDGSKDGSGGVRHHFVTNAQARADL